MLSKLKALKWDILFILKSLPFALFVVGIWYMLRSHGIAFSEKSDSSMTDASFAIALFDGIVAGYALLEPINEQKQMAAAILDEDLHKYLLYRDERVPRVMPLYAGTLSFLLLMFLTLRHYEQTVCGAMIIGSVAFTIIMYFMVLAKIDDPRGSPWFKQNTPKGWDTITMREYKERSKKLSGIDEL